MSCMDAKERAEMVDMVAQAVIDRMEERNKVNTLVEMVVQRIFALQQQEAALREQEQATAPILPKETQNVESGSQS